MFVSIIGGMVVLSIINIYSPASVEEDQQYEEEGEISSVKPAVSLCRNHCVASALFTFLAFSYHSYTVHQQTDIFIRVTTTVSILLLSPLKHRPENSKIKLCKYYLLA